MLGNLGQDPELKTFANSESVANFSVATSESWKDKNTGELREKNEWHRVSVFGQTASFVANYVRKGSHVCVEGQLHTRKWQDQQGQDRYTTEVVVRWPVGSLQLIGSAQQSNSGDRTPAHSPLNDYRNEQPKTWGSNSPAIPLQPAGQAPPSAPTSQTPAQPKWDDFDDDIPF